jgi:starch phosphorylase
MGRKFQFAKERKKIYELAFNLRWTYDYETLELFSKLSPRVWERCNHNPIAVLAEIGEDELRARLMTNEFQTHLNSCYESLQKYLAEVNKSKPELKIFDRHPVAYFTAEIGLHESLPVYSGGLGVLSGDHTKSASDIGLNFVAVTLFYRQGYFTQKINSDGWQQEEYFSNDPKRLPIIPVTDEAGNLVKVKVQIGHSVVTVAAYRAIVGRSTVYLLETNLPENEEHYRDLTSRVYGGDSTTRISQEILLGVGGVRMLRELEYDPYVYHMNEGHSAFLTLELLRENLLHGKTLEQGVEAVKQKCVFTTHTPVAAGHDRFTPDLINYSLTGLINQLGISLDEFMKFGRVNPSDQNETFCMTVLALKMSRNANAVSELNGKVSRQMWAGLYPGRRPEQVPIGFITNGIHILTWLAPEMQKFFEDQVGRDWLSKLFKPKQWNEAINQIPNEELWGLRYELRRKLVEFTRSRMRSQQLRYGNASEWVEKVLSVDALTIGFSRRFATYKRAPLIFSDLDRAVKIFSDSKRPVQLIFSGKAHPRDDAGKAYIQMVVRLTRDPKFVGKVVFLEDYDMNVARYLVSGCDLWLNNPRRPLEASGTSGEKVILNGGLNCSVMDGWWREAYDGSNGFAIGEDKDASVSPEEQDKLDAQNLYNVLENKVIPLFFDRDSYGIPIKWVKMIKSSMKSIAPIFNTNRMVKEYIRKYYTGKS